MTEEHLIRHCAPTLARIKTGSLFTCPFAGRQDLIRSVRDFNRRLGAKGLRVVPLRYKNGIGLIYVYRPRKLACDLKNSSVCRLLSSFGYACENADRCICRLVQRLAETEEFPHEIGLFLSYPPQDVYGFIHHREKAKYCGCWKVYGDVDSARRTFARYKKCSDIYWRMWCSGRTIEQLTVAA